MKKAIFTILGCSLLFAACTEKGPVINFHGSNSKDTTYVGPVPAPASIDAHNVLAEEFTGQSCPNCPNAHDAMEVLSTDGHLIFVGLYIKHMPQTNPPAGYKYDFRTDAATDISTTFYNGAPASAIPVAGFDRVTQGGTTAFGQADWAGLYDTRKIKLDSINLSVASSYSTTDTVATITAQVTYAYQMVTRHNLSVLIVEDSMIDKQETSGGVILDNYLFTNVCRAMVTAEPAGDEILDTIAVKEPGRVCVRVYKYKLDPSWKPEHCRVVAFVNYNGTQASKEVLQTMQCKLKN